jgi:hypothetical protein
LIGLAGKPEEAVALLTRKFSASSAGIGHKSHREDVLCVVDEEKGQAGCD